jgi:hypothetical protein
MRARLSSFVVLVAGTLSSVPIAAQLWKPQPGLTVWVDADYKGDKKTFLTDVPDLEGTGFDRVISSLGVGNGESWQVCTQPNYGGQCRTFTTGISNLREFQGWNDAIRSVRRTKAPAVAPSRAPAPEQPGVAVPPPVSPATLGPARGLELYAGTNYSGRRQVLTESTANFRSIDFSDRAMSLRVPRNETWEICINVDFDDCRLVTEDVPDLAAIGLTRLMSSARPHVVGRGGGRPQLVFYDAVNFRGRTLMIEDDRPSLGASNSMGSIRVAAGEWQICDRPRFYGNCVTISDDVRDVSRLGLRGPVASVRRNQER